MGAEAEDQHAVSKCLNADDLWVGKDLGGVPEHQQSGNGKGFAGPWAGVWSMFIFFTEG
jgi:hypothetical protein